MNKNNAKDYLPLVQALAEGKTLQVKRWRSGAWEDRDEVLFCTSPENFRIKPEPIERWGVVSKSGKFFTTCNSEQDAKELVASSGGRYFLMREVV